MDKRISALDAVQSLQDTDVLPIVNGNQTRKVSISQIKASIPVPDAQLPSDWNANTGVTRILNKPTIATQTSQLTNTGADGINPFITALDIPIAGQASTLVREVKNMTGATLTKGTVVYISGANGNKALVSKALATTDELSSRTFGLLQSNILNNGLGNCVIIGDLTGIDTSSFSEGAQLYLSGTVAGTYTASKILAPTHLVYVGKVTRSHPTLGQIEVGIQNGYELSEIHDVALSTPTNDQVLAYDFATSLWKNKTISQGTPLVREEFTYSGAQTFTLSNTPSAIYIVFVNGQELKQSQYSLSTNVLTILNTLEIVNGLPDKVSIIYTATLGGVLDYYTKAQTDAKSILTTSPLQGGGDLSANRTISIPMADADYDGYLSSSAFNTFTAKQDPITLTTNNFSGQSTLVGNTLNIPNYEGFIPKLKGHETFRGVNFSNNSTTEVTSGGVTMSTTASAIARSVSSTNFASKQIRKGFYGTVVSAGRYTGIRGSALLWFMGGGFKYVCDFYISDTAFGSGCRQFYGLAGQTTDLAYSDTILVSSLTNIIGVGSDALDTNLQIFHNDASGVATKVDLGINFPANRTAGAELTTIYSIELYNDSASTSVKYSVKNKETGAIATGTIATNLPLHTQGLNFFASRCMGAGVTNTGQFDLLTLGTYSL